MDISRATQRMLTIAAATVIAAASWWLSEIATVPPLAPPPPPGEPDYTIEGFASTVLDVKGAPRYRLAASQLWHFPGRGFEIERPYLIQYGEGAPTHTRAREGRLSEDRKTIEMRGEVRVARGRDPQHAAAEISTENLRVHLAE